MRLNNPRHEKFAQLIAGGDGQRAAYVASGFRAKSRGAQEVGSTHLVRRSDIRARIAELQEEQAKRVGVTVDALLAELNEMYQLAKRVKHPAAGVGAVLAKARLLGLLTDKQETEVNFVRKPSRTATDDKTMTLDEWQQKFAPDGEDTMQ